MRTKKFLIGYFIASLLAGVTFAVWRTILMLRYFDPYMKEYLPEAKPYLQTYGYVLFFALLLIATVSFFFIRFKNKGRKYDFAEFSASDRQSTTFTSALLGFLCLVIAVFLSFSLLYLLAPTKYIAYKYLQLLAFVALFFTAAYFILNATGAQRFEKSKKLLAFAPPVFAVSFLIASYINPSYLYRDFNHIICNISLCALTLFFVYDAKTVIMKKTSSAQFVFALLGLVTSMAYIIPNFILVAYWELSSEWHFIFEAVELGAIFYMACVACVLISLVRERAPEEAPAEYSPENETERESDEKC